MKIADISTTPYEECLLRDYHKFTTKKHQLQTEYNKFTGRVSIKNINGTDRVYHEYYEAGKKRTKFIPKNQEKEMLKAYNRHKELRKEMMETEYNLKILRKALGKKIASDQNA